MAEHIAIVQRAQVGATTDHAELDDRPRRAIAAPAMFPRRRAQIALRARGEAETIALATLEVGR